MRELIDAEGTRERILHTAGSIISRKGYSAVGINEILIASDVPKGSFYHYFPSKDAFGEAMLQDYFDEYLRDLDVILAKPGLTSARRLMNYWAHWTMMSELFDCQGKCLAVKLSAEVSDLSESMRLAVMAGTSAIIGRVSATITAGIEDGSITVTDDPDVLAQTLYEIWLGASVMAKVRRNPGPLVNAKATTTRLLNLQQPVPA